MGHKNQLQYYLFGLCNFLRKDLKAFPKKYFFIKIKKKKNF